MKGEISMQITEEMLKKAALIAADYEYTNYADTEMHIFSDDFYRKMDQIIASGGKKEAKTKAPAAASITKIHLFRKKLAT